MVDTIDHYGRDDSRIVCILSRYTVTNHQTPPLPIDVVGFREPERGTLERDKILSA
ncbi:MAG TPA: hypothetical protein VKG25_12350 [Bryobacteraceae bacterium]|nr:hypothetical protein [Bryobacteraceae bacterium]